MARQTTLRNNALHKAITNHEHYVAGALHAHTGRLFWAEHHRKNSVLFLKLLEHLRRQYRRAKRIVLILDNYCIHTSRATERWLEKNPKFVLLFQPTYYPWVNVIERLWKAMHDTVTRNHRCRSMYELCQFVARFLEVVQPFHGNGHGKERCSGIASSPSSNGCSITWSPSTSGATPTENLIQAHALTVA